RIAYDHLTQSHFLKLFTYPVQPDTINFFQTYLFSCRRKAAYYDGRMAKAILWHELAVRAGLFSCRRKAAYYNGRMAKAILWYGFLPLLIIAHQRKNGKGFSTKQVPVDCI